MCLWACIEDCPSAPVAKTTLASVCSHWLSLLPFKVLFIAVVIAMLWSHMVNFMELCHWENDTSMLTCSSKLTLLQCYTGLCLFQTIEDNLKYSRSTVHFLYNKWSSAAVKTTDIAFNQTLSLTFYVKKTAKRALVMFLINRYHLILHSFQTEKSIVVSASKIQYWLGVTVIVGDIDKIFKTLVFLKAPIYLTLHLIIWKCLRRKTIDASCHVHHSTSLNPDLMDIGHGHGYVVYALFLTLTWPTLQSYNYLELSDEMNTHLHSKDGNHSNLCYSSHIALTAINVNDEQIGFTQ